MTDSAKEILGGDLLEGQRKAKLLSSCMKELFDFAKSRNSGFCRDLK